MARKLVLVVLLATLAACTGSITAPDSGVTAAQSEAQLGGGIATSGG